MHELAELAAERADLLGRVLRAEGEPEAAAVLGYRGVADGRGEEARVGQVIGRLQGKLGAADDDRHDGALDFFALRVELGHFLREEGEPGPQVLAPALTGWGEEKLDGGPG